MIWKRIYRLSIFIAVCVMAGAMMSWICAVLLIDRTASVTDEALLVNHELDPGWHVFGRGPLCLPLDERAGGRVLGLPIRLPAVGEWFGCQVVANDAATNTTFIAKLEPSIREVERFVAPHRLIGYARESVGFPFPFVEVLHAGSFDERTGAVQNNRFGVVELGVSGGMLEVALPYRVAGTSAAWCVVFWAGLSALVWRIWSSRVMMYHRRRTARRSRAGLCPVCAYEMTDSGRCPECGAPPTVRANASLERSVYMRRGDELVQSDDNPLGSAMSLSECDSGVTSTDLEARVSPDRQGSLGDPDNRRFGHLVQ